MSALPSAHELYSQSLDLAREIAEAEKEVTLSRIAVIKRMAELVHDDTYVSLTNDRHRKIFLEEYLDYDGLIERESEAISRRDYLIRVFTINQIYLTHAYGKADQVDPSASGSSPVTSEVSRLTPARKSKEHGLDRVGYGMEPPDQTE